MFNSYLPNETSFPSRLPDAQNGCSRIGKLSFDEYAVGSEAVQNKLVISDMKGFKVNETENVKRNGEVEALCEVIKEFASMEFALMEFALMLFETAKITSGFSIDELIVVNTFENLILKSLKLGQVIYVVAVTGATGSLMDEPATFWNCVLMMLKLEQVIYVEAVTSADGSLMEEPDNFGNCILTILKLGHVINVVAVTGSECSLTAPGTFGNCILIMLKCGLNIDADAGILFLSITGPDTEGSKMIYGVASLDLEIISTLIKEYQKNPDTFWNHTIMMLKLGQVFYVVAVTGASSWKEEPGTFWNCILMMLKLGQVIYVEAVTGAEGSLMELPDTFWNCILMMLNLGLVIFVKAIIGAKGSLMIYDVASLDREIVITLIKEYQTIIGDPFMLATIIMASANNQDTDGLKLREKLEVLCKMIKKVLGDKIEIMLNAEAVKDLCMAGYMSTKITLENYIMDEPRKRADVSIKDSGYAFSAVDEYAVRYNAVKYSLFLDPGCVKVPKQKELLKVI